MTSRPTVPEVTDSMPSDVPSDVADTVAGAALPIVLTGGPCDGHWYTRDDFKTRQLAARRMAAVHRRRPTDPASVALGYVPTATVVRHHRHPERRAVQWTWTGPAEARTIGDLARIDAEAAGAIAAARLGDAA